MVKLFVLGLPGSGKSTVVRNILMHARDRQWLTTHINDYTILYEMFKEDTGGQYKYDANGGFDVLDMAVFDTALRELEQNFKMHISRMQSKEMVLIEFSRNDYEKAFQQFSQEFLHDAYFIYLNVDLSNCKKRIRNRITHPATLDDHCVSEYIFNSYYNEDDGRNIPQILANNHGVEIDRVKVINNNESLSESMAKVYQFLDAMCGSEHL